MSAALAIFRRDVRAAFRSDGGAWTTTIYFMLAAIVFAIAIGPAPDQLATLAPAVFWTSALLSSLAALDRTLRDDLEDGVLDQMLETVDPLALGVLAKAAAHWATAIAPLIVAAPMLGVFYSVDRTSLGPLLAALLIGSPALSLFGVAISAIALSVKRAGVLIAVLTLPLLTPTLIFGVDAAQALKSRRPGVRARSDDIACDQPRRQRHRAACRRRRLALESGLAMQRITDLANPTRFEKVADPASRALGWLAAALIMAGLYFALFASPADYQQGQSVRIMYVHVPAAWLALFAYTLMAAASAAGFIWKHPLADVAAKTAAPLGAAFTLLALITGSLWGKPMWGAWWAWDARLTSVLILFFMYVGYIVLWETIADSARAARIAAIACIVGFVNVPIIKFSVDWWNSLHQPASVMRSDGPSIDGAMLIPLFLMGAGYMALFGWLHLVSIRSELKFRRAVRLEKTHAGASPSRFVVS